MSKEAMNLALEALEDDSDYAKRQTARVALREALAEPDFWEGYVPEPDKRQQALDKKAENARELGLDYEPAQQEPVAYLCEPDENGLYGLPLTEKTCTKCFPVYRHPQRTWVGLSDVEWMNIVNKDQAWFGQRPDEVAHEVAKLVEAKLREKNQ